MKTIEMPDAAQLAHDAEQLLGLVRVQAGRRFVEDQDPREEISSARAIAAICWIATE